MHTVNLWYILKAVVVVGIIYLLREEHRSKRTLRWDDFDVYELSLRDEEEWGIIATTQAEKTEPNEFTSSTSQVPIPSCI